MSSSVHPSVHQSIRLSLLTSGLHALTQLRLHLAVGSLGCQLRQLAGHCGGGDDGLEAALVFGNVLLRMKDNHVDLWHVEHSQRDGGAEAEGDGQRGRLDVHLRRKRRNRRVRGHQMTDAVRNAAGRRLRIKRSLHKLATYLRLK